MLRVEVGNRGGGLRQRRVCAPRVFVLCRSIKTRKDRRPSRRARLEPYSPSSNACAAATAAARARQGRARVACEGLNCNLSGRADGVRAYCSALRRDWAPLFDSTDFKARAWVERRFHKGQERGGAVVERVVGRDEMMRRARSSPRRRR